MAESNVSGWPQKILIDQLLKILVNAEPQVKIVALQIYIELFHYSLLNDHVSLTAFFFFYKY